MCVELLKDPLAMPKGFLIYTEMKNLKFYKETSGKWFVDLPEWIGDKTDLEMVSGADTMLDIISEGENEVVLLFSKKYFGNSTKLEFTSLATDIGNGAYYKLYKYKAIEFNLEIWLCDVTKFVFGYFPKEMFFIKIN